MGRPTGYRQEYCERIVELMGEGLSKTASAGELGVCRDPIHEWTRVHPEFSDAVKKGEAARTLKLERDLIRAPDGPTVTSRIFALKNAAPEEWRDKVTQVHEDPNGKPAGVSAVETLANLLDKLAPESS